MSGCRRRNIEPRCVRHCRQTERRLAKLDEADVRVKGFGNSFLGVGTQHQTTNARAVTELRVRIRQTMRGTTTYPGIFERRLNVVVPAAPVVPGNENRHCRPILAFCYCADPVSGLLHSQLDAGWRMFAKLNRRAGSIQPGNIRKIAIRQVGVETGGGFYVRTSFERSDLT